MIQVTEEEKQRILDQKWTAADGVATDQPVVIAQQGSFWGKKWYRLAHRADGACVFLDDRGLCRIHAKFGEAAKPLACRIYPYAFHPAGKEIAVSLRFSCPSVVSNRGTACIDNRAEIESIARLVVPEGADRVPPPSLNARQTVDWDDILRVIKLLDELVSDTDTPLIPRLYLILRVLGLLDQANLGIVRGERLEELLDVLTDAVGGEEIPAARKPGRLAGTHFRLLVAHYSRKDTVADLQPGLGRRWEMLCAAGRFARGAGRTPVLQEGLEAVSFCDIEGMTGELPAGVNALLTRYLRVKVQGMHFCGRAFYDIPLIEGFQTLILAVVVVFWIARWIAVSERRTQWQLTDFERALAIVDHHHGYAPKIGSSGFRSRVKFLSFTGELSNLLLWYGGRRG